MNRWSGWITSWEQDVHWDNKITFVYFCICSVRLYIIIYHIYLESVCTAGDGRKYIVGVHCPQNELASVPELETLLVSTLQPGGPPLEAAHAHGRQVGLAPIVLHLFRNSLADVFLILMCTCTKTYWNAGRGVLAWGEEEGAVDQGIPGQTSITSNSQFLRRNKEKKNFTSQRCSSCSCRERTGPDSSCWWRSWRG